MPSVCLLYYLMEIRRHEDMKGKPRDPTMILALILLSRYLAGVCPMWIAEKQEGRNEEVGKEEQVQAKAEPIQEFWNHRLWPVAKEEFKKYAEANSEVLPRTDNPRMYKIKGSILALLWNEYHQIAHEKGEGEGNPVLRLCEAIEGRMGTSQRVEVLRRFLQQITKGSLDGKPHHNSFTKEEREAMFYAVWSLITPSIQKKVYLFLPFLSSSIPSIQNNSPHNYSISRSTRSSLRAFGPFDCLSYWIPASFAHMSATG